MINRIVAIGVALWDATRLNLEMLRDRAVGLKTIALHISASTQSNHIENIVRELLNRNTNRTISIAILTKSSEVSAVQSWIDSIAPGISVRREQAARFLLFCNFFLSVEQGMVFPYIFCKTRACCFHGQPSKGNVFQRFNYRQINILFLYGPLMRDLYLRTQHSNPHWPLATCYEVGQPLSDNHVKHNRDECAARNKLGLDIERLTVIYAPSFEYCSSLATNGIEIIQAILDSGINLIIKPHPAFYNQNRFDDPFNHDAPNVESWIAQINLWNLRPNCLFPMQNSLDSALALEAANIMLTDFSGVAFDGILSDLGMIYWNCPLLYSEYLPKRYGVRAAEAKTDLACNAGIACGTVVNNIGELLKAIREYQANPSTGAIERENIRQQLLFNPGKATKAMVDKIEEIIRAPS